MIQILPGEERGSGQLDWLDSRFSFSFADYYDPKHINFRSLRVINEDKIAPSGGFGMHPHRDMEIITYVLDGTIEHRDSMGNRGVIRPGEIQKMTAGTGILHSEFNPSKEKPTHLLQIWILPEKQGLKPEYEEHKFTPGELNGKFQPIAGKEAPVSIHQDVELFAAKFAKGEKDTHKLSPGRHAWLQVARGAGKLNGQIVKAGDGAAISDQPEVVYEATEPSEVLLFDLG
jgi:redox-sensitive bicupin YhaK (pirin superfamily)